MLERTGADTGTRLMMLVLHDDAELTAPPMACRDTKVGIFSRGLMDEAKKKGWTVTA